jgi:hypothetical protein
MCIIIMGIVGYHANTFIKNNYRLDELPKFIINIILNILCVIMPFWFVVGLFDPISQLVGLIGAFDGTLKMNPSSGGEGSNQGNFSGNSGGGGNSGGNPGGGNFGGNPGDQPPHKGGYWDVILGDKSPHKNFWDVVSGDSSDKGKSSLPSAEDKGKGQSLPSAEDKGKGKSLPSAEGK